MDQIAEHLFNLNAIKFGNFTLKSGLQSPVYFDFRAIISYPSVLEKIAGLLWEVRGDSPAELICGVPYTALPLATIISVKNDVPMLLRRKEAKDYGTKKLIEGDFRPGQTCLIVEDVVTSGTSILETARELEAVGLKVTDAIVLLDRMQGGSENLAKHGITMRPVARIDTLMAALENCGKITAVTVQQVLDFMKANPEDILPQEIPRPKLSLDERLRQAKNPATQQLFRLMLEKQSNLCVAADFNNFSDLLTFAEAVGPEIVVLKTHVDILNDFTQEGISKLQEISEKHKFLIMEDRKFADIGNTVDHQYTQGLFKIRDWAHLVTVHALPGPQMITTLKAAAQAAPTDVRGFVLLTEMSSKGALTSSQYVKDSAKIANDNRECVSGFVGQSALGGTDFPGWLQFTPGVHLSQAGDSKGQQYTNPEEAVLQKQADVIIVGRGITAAPDSRAAAAEYRKLGWAALMKRMQ